MKAIRVLILVIFSVVVLGAFTSCSDSPYEDCYKETKKALIKEGKKSDRAARDAKRACS